MPRRQAIRPRILVLALVAALGVYAAFTTWADHRRMALVGLTERPCGADGQVVTGRPLDDWATLCGYREENRRMIAAGIRPGVVMIGDSLTAAWPRAGLERHIVTRGVGGQASGQVLLRFRQDALALRPRIVHIWVGTNDIAGHTGPVALDQITANLLDMVERARAHGIKVIVGTVPPARDFKGFRLGDPAPDIARLNALLRHLSSRRGLVLADYHAALLRPDGTVRKALFMEDGIHLTAAGYEALRPVLTEALAKAS